ncbi:DUF202 domain-containing protein [Arthrobacter cheniae]|uniref:DUF202 domain-containing protein n=1 Tax=Arthrobacter cheniae TaxID=1258888 RepID=A0A3A5M7R9_9MICC|nr:DUF202 domain-containing protein [Arthrobacter cheniae]
MNAGSELIDVGLPSERTALAWRRTALSVALGSLVAFRLLPELLGNPLWAGAGLMGVIGATLMWVTSERRYRAFHRGEVPMPHTPFGAWPLFILAACVALLGLGALALAINLAST